MAKEEPYTYKDFVTEKLRRTFGTFERWVGPMGPLNAFYAEFRCPKTFIAVPDYCLTMETRQRLPAKPARTTKEA